MGQKDLRLKKLFSHNDIFADVLNVLLFNGRQVVKPEELIDAGTDSQYEGDRLAHGQDQDCAKYWMINGRIIAKFCLENQVDILWYMPVRSIGYVGASYREEFNDDDIEKLTRTAEDPGYTVILLVLYYGKRRWNSSRSLNDVMKVPEILRKYANDYRMNLFEMSWLSPEQVKLFQSDLRVMTDYLVQDRMIGHYHPSNIKIIHKHDFFEAMDVLTDREWLTEEVEDMIRKGEEVTMISAYAEVEKRGYDRGVEYGKAQMKSAYAEVEKRGYDRGVEYGKAQMKSAYAEVEKRGYDRGVEYGKAQMKSAYAEVEKRGYDRGVEYGKAQMKRAYAEVEKRGYDRGVEYGKAQMKSAYENAERNSALKMLKAGKLSEDDVSEYTGLSKSEIEELKKSL